MGSHAASQTQKEGQIAETVADYARPCASGALGNKGKRHTCDCHAKGIPESRLHEQMEYRPRDAMNNPCGPSERQLLAWQYIAAPPKLFPADIAHEH